jgi:hypothetical protein
MPTPDLPAFARARASALLAVLVLSVAGVADARTPACPPVSGNSWEAERCAEMRLIAARPGLAQRRGDRLVLTLDDGRRVAVVDRRSADADDTDAALHALIAVLDAPRLFHLRTTFYEGAQTLLVGRSSGRRWVVGGDAIEPSPDGLRVVAWSARNGYDDGALEVWRLDGDRLVLEFRGLTDTWWPRAVRWIDASTIGFERVAGGDPDTARGPQRRLVRDDTTNPPRWRAAAAR